MIKRWLIKYYKGRCYCSIDDLPVYYWNKIKTEDNLAYLIKSPSIALYKKKANRFKTIALKEVWRGLMDEYIARFGFSEAHLELLRKQRELIGYMVRRIVEDDKSLNSYIRACEREVEELKAEMGQGSGDFWELKSFIEASLKIQLSLMNTSVAEFYSYLRMIAKQNKKEKSVEQSDDI